MTELPQPDADAAPEDALLGPDPLEERQQQLGAILSRHPVRVLLIVLSLAGMFVAGAVTSGIIEDVSATWFREQATPFLLRPSAVSNGWLLFLVVAGVALIAVFVAAAIHNYRQVRLLTGQIPSLASEATAKRRETEKLVEEVLSAQTELKNLQGVLDNQGRLLDRFQRDQMAQDQTFEQMTAATEREREIVATLSEALVFMVRSIQSGEAPANGRQRFFSVFKRAVPRLFARPEDILNVCVLVPEGKYLCFGPDSTMPLPPEVAACARYYIGNKDSLQHESGIEGELYRQVRRDDSNLAEIEPMIVRVADRANDKAPDHNNYIGFYGRAGMTAPFSSYLVLPISHRWGVLRIESMAEDTFGRSLFMPLKQLIRLLELAYVATARLDADQGEEHND